MSREYVLRHETALAQVNVSSEGRYLLPGFYNYIFTTLAWNNDDFCEETKTGNGTTRVTSGIIIQRQSYQVEELVRISVARSSLLEFVPDEIILYALEKGAIINLMVVL